MNGFALSTRSLNRLSGVHGDLIRVAVRALQICKTDFGVHEGLRTLARQRLLKIRGKSQTLRSRHLTGHAVDLWIYPLDWKDEKRWKQLVRAMQRASATLNVPIECGADWTSLVDYPHFQLPRTVG